jgi:competence protein ComEA
VVSFDVNQDPDRPGPSPPSVDPPFRPGPRRHAEALIARVRPWAHWVGGGRIVTAAVTVLAVGAGGWWLLRAPPPPTEAGLPYAAASTTTPTTSAVTVENGSTEATSSSAVVVHVAGAVAEPGVYELPSGSRVHAAIDAAGGPLRKAEPSALNLAAPLVDGERIYVPRVGENVPAAAVDVATSGTVAQPSGPIDVNHATVEQLDELPGIGPTTAAAIVDHRQQNGPFASVDDLEAVSGIGPAKLEAIRDLVSV